MAFDFFKKKNDGAGDGDKGDKKASSFKRDPRKGRSWFKYAQTAADSHNYDYAITCYIDGLKHEPGNQAMFEALYEVARKRKASGGKPAGFGDKMKMTGKDPTEKLIHVLQLWAKDPFNIELMVKVMETASDLNDADEEVDLAEVIYWLGGLVLDASVQATKRPGKGTYVNVRDMLVKVSSFERAVLACRLAIQQAPEDANLVSELKQLEAELTMQKGGYDPAARGGGDFRSMMKNAEQQRNLEMDTRLVKTDSQVDEEIVRKRAEFEEAPEDEAKLTRLVEALRRKALDPTENEAIKLLLETWERTGQYKFKLLAGDIRMKQYERHLKAVKAEVEATPDNVEQKKKMADLVRRKAQFELEEYGERSKNYPTDMVVRYELGKRLYLFKKFDEAVAAFQESQADPKVKARSLQYQGMCYLEMGYFDEAVGSLRRGIETHKLSDDSLALDLRYLLMDALEKSAKKNNSIEQARESQQIASTIMQININYRDIRARLDRVRKLVDELSKPATA